MATRSLGQLTLDLILKLGGFTAGATKAQREAEKIERKLRDAFKAASSGTEGALGAFDKLTTKIRVLNEQLAAGRIGAQKYADEFKKAQAAFQLASRPPEQIRRDTDIAAIRAQKAGVISQRELNAVLAESQAKYQAATASSRAYANVLAQARTIMQSTLSPQQKLVQLQALYAQALRVGTTNQQQFNNALARTRASVVGHTTAFGKLDFSIRRLRYNIIALFGAYSAFSGVRAILGLGNEYLKLTNKLKVVARDTQALAKAQNEVYRIAQLTRNPLEDVGDLYSRIARNTASLGITQSQVSTLTEIISKLLTASGASAQEASAGLIQFGQALSSNKLAGDELRSILENLPVLAEAVAQGLGISRDELRQLGKEGLLTRRFLVEGLLTQGANATKLFNNTIITLDGAFQILKNSIEQAAGSANFTPLVNAIIDLAHQIEDPAFRSSLTEFTQAVIALTTGFIKLTGAIGGTIVALGEMFARFGALGGLARLLPNSPLTLPIKILFDADDDGGRSDDIEVILKREFDDLVAQRDRLIAQAKRPVLLGGLQLGDDVTEEQLRLQVKGYAALSDAITATSLSLKDFASARIAALEPRTEEALLKAFQDLVQKREQLLAQVARAGTAITDEQRQAVADLDQQITSTSLKLKSAATNRIKEEEAAAAAQKKLAAEFAAQRAQEQDEQKLKSATESIENFIQKLEEQRETLGKGSFESERFSVTQGKIAEALRIAGKAAGVTKKELLALIDALERDTAIQKLIDENKELDKQAVELEAARIEVEKGAVAADAYRQQFGELGETVRLATGQIADLGRQAGTLPDIKVGADIAQAKADIDKLAIDQGLQLRVTADVTDAKKALEDFRKTVKDPAGFPIDLSRPRLPVPGGLQTEFTITEEIEGRWYNLPQIVEGVMVDVEKAIEDARRRIAQGDPFTIPGFATREEAEAAAPLRSAAIDDAIKHEAALIAETQAYKQQADTIADANAILEERKKKLERNEQLNAVKTIEDQIRSLEEEIRAFEQERIALEQGAVAALEYRIAHGDLKQVFDRAGEGAEALTKRLKELTRIQEQQSAIDAARDLVPSRTEAAQAYFKVIGGLRILLDEGEISQRQFNAAVRQAERDFKDATRAAGDLTDVFRDEAMRAAERSIAEFLTEPFKEGLAGMVDGFTQALREIAANIVAAQLSKRLFEGFEDGFAEFKSETGGFIEGLKTFFGTLFGGDDRPLEGLLEPIEITARRLPEATAETAGAAALTGAATAVTGAATALAGAAAPVITAGAGITTAAGALTASAAPLTAAAAACTTAAGAISASAAALAAAAKTVPGGSSGTTTTSALTLLSNFVGPREKGGPIPQGKWALVGERAPEISIPAVGPAQIVGAHGPEALFADRATQIVPMRKFVEEIRTVIRERYPSEDLRAAFERLFHGMPKFASGGPLDVQAGGMLHGPGTSTSDSMLLLGSTKEFMVRAQAVQQPGAAAFLSAFNNGRITMDQIAAGFRALKLPVPSESVINHYKTLNSYQNITKPYSLDLPGFATGGPLWGASQMSPSYIDESTSSVDRWQPTTIVQQMTINSNGGNVSRSTQLQVAAAAARGARLADKRNN